MKLKLIPLLITSLSPLVFLIKGFSNTSKSINFLPTVELNKSNLISLEDKDLLINEQGWTVKSNPLFCKLINRVNYSETYKFVVSCKNTLASNPKELILPTFLLLSGDSLGFWVDLEKDNLIYFYSFSKSKESWEEEVKNTSLDNCLFIGSFNNEFSICFLNWRILDHLREFRKNYTVKNGQVLPSSKFA